MIIQGINIQFTGDKFETDKGTAIMAKIWTADKEQICKGLPGTVLQEDKTNTVYVVQEVECFSPGISGRVREWTNCALLVQPYAGEIELKMEEGRNMTFEL